MNIRKFLGAAAVVAALAAPSYADSVWVRYGDGRVVYVPRARSQRYVTQGGVIVEALPSGYVNQPYVVTGGYPVYYHQDYWYRHRRRWHHDDDYWRRHHNRW